MLKNYLIGIKVIVNEDGKVFQFTREHLVSETTKTLISKQWKTFEKWYWLFQRNEIDKIFKGSQVSKRGKLIKDCLLHFTKKMDPSVDYEYQAKLK